MWLFSYPRRLWAGIGVFLCQKRPLAPYTWRVAALLLGLVACEPAPLAEPAAPPSAGAAWWEEALFYEIFVRSFYDGSGDGTGDLNGLAQALDYLNDGDPETTEDLGVTALYLMPVTQAASYHGYDTVDYYRVSADYGDNEQFRAFIAEAHERGLRVIIDLPLNHTSDEHPWFAEARTGPSAAYRDWYIWSDSRPTYAGVWDQPVWHPAGNAFYYGAFWEKMPDLNYRNPAVTAEMQAIARFWLTEMGVDGFRLDAARHLIEDGEQQVNRPETRAWLADFRRFVATVKPEAVVVGEVWDETAAVAPYVQNRELDLAFEFALAEAIVVSVNLGDPGALRHQLAAVTAAYPPGHYATFLANHDQSRILNQLGGHLDRARLAATTLLALPGVPFIYYGEELGMSGARPPDEAVRTPMQWAAVENAFFTSNEQAWTAVNPDYETVNVAAQLNDPGSLLNHYRQLIHLRQEHVALRLGGLATLTSNCREVFGFLRHVPHTAVQPGAAVLVLLNFSPLERSDCVFSLAGSPLPSGEYTARPLLGELDGGAVVVGEDGRISAYTPIHTFAPRAGYLIELTPVGINLHD
jgi:alpha-amylase